MQKMFLVICLAMSSVAFNADAATLNWVYTPAKGTNIVNNPHELMGDIGNQVHKGGMQNKWIFNLSDLSKISIHVTEMMEQFLDINVTLDNVALSNSNGNWSFLGLLDPGKHVLKIKGFSFAKGTNIGIDIATIPVPAAIWLFGSALVFVTGFKRRLVA